MHTNHCEQDNHSPVPEYRREGGRLYKYDHSRRAYIHVFRSPRLERASLKKLIDAYRNADD